MKKIRVGILCGGKSGEHEVSLQSAKNIFEAIDKDRYEVIEEILVVVIVGEAVALVKVCGLPYTVPAELVA